ncbi:hypothetical protein VO54_00021 [Elizabethkingia miricola]|nr:hypothetical protein VO54_00021 [Elizabethkingia miricola]
MKKNCVLFFVFILGILCTGSLYSQSSHKEVDVLMEKGLKLSKENKYIENIILSREILNKSIGINYKKGIVRGYTMLAYEYDNIGDYTKSLEYANLIRYKFKDTLNGSPQLNYTVLMLIESNYRNMGLKKEALKISRQLLQVADEFKEQEKLFIYKRSAYTELYSCYKGVNKDSVYYYMMKAKYWDTQLEHFSTPSPESLKKSTLYFSIAEYHVENTNNIDSAYYYVNKGVARRGAVNTSLYRSGRTMGMILMKQEKYPEALESAILALKDAKKKNKTDELIPAYKLISDIYGLEKNKVKQEEYLNKFYHIKDSLNSAKEKTIQESVDLIKSIESEKADTVQRRLVLLSALGIIIILIATGYFIIRIKKKKQRQIAEGQEDIRKLESRVNDAFEEVIIMAKNNDPAFLGRFREVYPDFCQKILMIYPDIVNSEFAFCAYLKLNFSTKEIATYTFVTPSAIQNRKNRLRKKLNIPSDEDIYTWINKIG